MIPLAGMFSKRKWLIGKLEKPVGLAFLIWFHIVICCVSLVYASYASYSAYPYFFNAPMYHIFYDPSRLYCAVGGVSVFALVSFLFPLVQFSFGYFIGFYFYTMVLNYVWLNCFSDLIYNHQLAGLSAVTSAFAFLIPALLIVAPIRQTYIMSARALEYLLAFILLLAVATIAIGAIYNFQFVALGDIYTFRDKLKFPIIEK